MSDRIEAEILDVLGEEVDAAVDTPLVVIEGPKGEPGAPGKDGITPTIGANGNWYLGATDTGKPSRGATGTPGKDGQPGADGKSAYAYAAEGGYTGTEEEFAAKLAEEMSDGGLRVTNPNDSSHELHAGNQWAIFVRDSRLRAISITPVFSDGSSDQTFSWQLCETSDGSDVDYNSAALTILKSGTANCGDTLTFDSFTSRNALCILTTDPVKMRYCPPSTAVNRNIRVGLRRNMAVMSTDYGCLSGAFILTIDDEPFMLKSAFTDKTISFYGDSLTQAVPSQYSKGYRNWIVELCGFASQTNRGASGYRLWQILDAISANTETSDCISVMGGYNDGNQWDYARLGSLGDTTALESNEDATGTIYGTVYQICAVLKAKYPTTFLMFITPPAEKNPVSGKVSLAEIRKAILETAELFSIPVYDNYKLSGVDVTNLNIYTSDGTHWTDVTHEMVGKNIAKWMLATVGKTREISGASAGTGTDVVVRKERVSQFENDSGYVTETYVQNQISLIPDELPTVTDADNGKVLRVVSSAWAAADMPSGGSPDALLYTPQTLTDAQKKQARENIDATASDFVINATVASDNTCTTDKTYAQIQEAIQDGKRAVMKARLSGTDFILPQVGKFLGYYAFAAVLNLASNVALQYTIMVGEQDNGVINCRVVTYDTDGNLQQVTMDSDPTEAMEIATKKYVDDSVPTALKNPNELTIKIGSTTVTYDGSTAQTVTIADGSEVAY